MAVDMELVQALNRVVDGDGEGFNVIYQKTYSYVYARCRMIMKNDDDAQELLQETYLQAFRSLDKLENVNGIYAWIGAIAYNQGMKMFRKKKEVLLDEDGQGLFEVQETADVSTLPGNEMELKETADIVKDIIEELPDAQKAVITAYYYDEMSVSKIAELMGTSTGTIKSRLNYARKHIQESEEAKEKEMGIRLHSVSIPVLILALRGKANAMVMSAEAAEANYAAICSKSGITASAGFHAGQAGTAPAKMPAGEASVVNREMAVTADEIKNPIVSSMASTTGKSASTMLVTKILVGVAVLSVIIGGVFVGKLIKNIEDTVDLVTSEEETTEQENTTEEPNEESTEESSEDIAEEPVKEDNDEKDAMENELTQAKIRNAYMGVVWQALHGKWADGTDVDFYVVDAPDEYTGEFYFVDVFGDGRELLYINYGDIGGSNPGGTSGIYMYNQETGKVDEVRRDSFNYITFYEGGVITSHRPPLQAGWHYAGGVEAILEYDTVNASFNDIGGWEGVTGIREGEYEFYKGLVEIDEDGNDTVYTFPGSDGYKDDAEFQTWYDSYFGNLKEIELETETISRENIRKYSSEFFDQLEKKEQADTPGVYDMGISYMRTAMNERPVSEMSGEITGNASGSLIQEPEDGDFTPFTMEGKKVIIFNKLDAGTITYQD